MVRCGRGPVGGAGAPARGQALGSEVVGWECQSAYWRFRPCLAHGFLAPASQASAKVHVMDVSQTWTVKELGPPPVVQLRSIVPRLRPFVNHLKKLRPADSGVFA